MLTTAQLVSICDRPENDNMRSVLTAMNTYGPKVGMDRPHRVAQYIAQLAHESARFRYDKEIWGNTAAQKRYDTRTDLGNTAAADGDGYLYRGRGPIQITGKANYAAFTKWAQEIDRRAPDFVTMPDAVNTDPWEGLGPLWYWSSRNINRYADVGDNENVTRVINGGKNGLEDRLALYARAALVLLGYPANDVRAFQSSHGLTVDGDAGPNTRAAMHKALTGMNAPSAPVAAPIAPPADLPHDDRMAALIAAVRAAVDPFDTATPKG